MILRESVSLLLVELAAEPLDVPSCVILVLSGDMGRRFDVLEVVIEGRSADHASTASWSSHELKESHQYHFITLLQEFLLQPGEADGIVGHIPRLARLLPSLSTSSTGSEKATSS